jgi:hypothetical protein
VYTCMGRVRGKEFSLVRMEGVLLWSQLSGSYATKINHDLHWGEPHTYGVVKNFCIIPSAASTARNCSYMYHYSKEENLAKLNKRGLSELLVCFRV